MSADDTTSTSAAAPRQDIFRAVVEAQDGGMAVAASRTAVAARFGVSEADVRDIEREGLAAGWPPL